MSRVHLLASLPLGENDYPDSLQTMRAALALGQSVSVSQVNSFQVKRDMILHVEEVEPVDGDLPDECLVFWVELGPPGPSKLFVKVRDDLGVIRTGSINLA